MAFCKCCCSGKEDEGCCSDFSWTQFFIWAIIVIVAGVFIFLVVAYSVVRAPKAVADDAVLQRFALTPVDPLSNSTVSYNISAAVSLRNPKIYRAIEWGALAVTFSFNGIRFDDSASISGFELMPRMMDTVHVTVGGVDKPVKFTKPGLGEFRAENETGWFAVEMQLHTVLQYKGHAMCRPVMVVCPLQLQLVDPDVTATLFQPTKCTILRAKKFRC